MKSALPLRLQAATGMRILQIAAGYSHYLLLSATGSLIVIGEDIEEVGLLGLGEPHFPVDRTPKVVPGFKGRRLVDIAAGSSHSAAVDEAGARTRAVASMASSATQSGRATKSGTRRLRRWSRRSRTNAFAT